MFVILLEEQGYIMLPYRVWKHTGNLVDESELVIC